MFYLLPSFNGGLFLWVSHLLWNGTVRCWESGLGYVECQFRYVAPMLLVSKSVAHSIMRALVILVSPCGLTGKASVVTYTSVLCDHLVFISFSLAIIISSCKADVHTLLHPSWKEKWVREWTTSHPSQIPPLHTAGSNVTGNVPANKLGPQLQSQIRDCCLSVSGPCHLLLDYSIYCPKSVMLWDLP